MLYFFFFFCHANAAVKQTEVRVFTPQGFFGTYSTAKYTWVMGLSVEPSSQHQKVFFPPLIPQNLKKAWRGLRSGGRDGNRSSTGGEE